MQAERRKEERVVAPGRGHVYLSYAGIEEQRWPRLMPAVCMDTSESGIGVLTPLALTEGLAVEVMRTPPKSEHERATVKWCRSIGTDLYLAGISFEGAGG